MKTICEFDMAVPDDRKKSRIVEDKDGYWRIQSLCPHPDPREKKLVWRDEYRMDSEWPAEVPTVVKNQSSVLKAVAAAALPKKKAKAKKKDLDWEKNWHKYQ